MTLVVSRGGERKLWYFLKQHNLENIYSTLQQNEIELEHLESIEKSDIEDLCQSTLKLTIVQKIRFKKAIQELQATKESKYVQKNVKYIPINTTQNITIIGNSCVGKTWLIRRLKTQQQPGNNIGYTQIAESTSIEVKINDNLSANYHLWDTPGQLAYRDTAPLYFKGSLVIIVVYDICDEDSFETVKCFWIPMVENNGKGYDKILILGNKLDLKADRKVQENEAKMFAIKNDCEYMEVSCKTGDNIDLLRTWIHKQTENRVEREGEQEMKAKEQRALLYPVQDLQKKK
eukprot:210521_1